MAPDAEADELIAAADGRDDALEGLVRRREGGEPLAWVTGSTVFCGHRLAVAPGVFVPRPHTEQLATRAAAALPEGGRAVDLCTGSGAVAARLARSVAGAVVVGTDLDLRAVRCARANGVPAVVADLDAPLRPGRADVVTAVAPYVPTDALASLPRDVREHEPRSALDGGTDGLAVVTGVLAAAGRLLRPGGLLLLEVGGDQDRRLVADAVRAGLEVAHAWHDEHGDLRGLELRRRP